MERFAGIDVLNEVWRVPLSLPPPRLDDLDQQIRAVFGPPKKAARIALVRPDLLQCWVLLFDSVKDEFAPFTALKIGWMDHDPEDQAERVHEDVALAPVDLLGAVKSPDAARLSRFRTLTVDDPCGRLRLAACCLANPFPKDVLDVFQDPSDAPLTVLGIHRAPVGEVQREESPRTAGLQHVKHGIDQHTLRMDAFAPCRSWTRQQRLKEGPFLVRQIRAVPSPFHAPQ